MRVNQASLGFDQGDSDIRIEDYFNFLAEDDISIKGARIGIESVLDEYIYNNQTPKEIADRYYTLTLEQVYATILYYLQNPVKVGDYLANNLNYCQRLREEHEKSPPHGVIRLHELIAERQSVSDESPRTRRKAALQTQLDLLPNMYRNKDASVPARRTYSTSLPHAIAVP